MGLDIVGEGVQIVFRAAAGPIATSMADQLIRRIGDDHRAAAVGPGFPKQFKEIAMGQNTIASLLR